MKYVSHRARHIQMNRIRFLGYNLTHGNNMFLCLDTNFCTKFTAITYEGLAGWQDERAFIAKLWQYWWSYFYLLIYNLWFDFSIFFIMFTFVYVCLSICFCHFLFFCLFCFLLYLYNLFLEHAMVNLFAMAGCICLIEY